MVGLAVHLLATVRLPVIVSTVPRDNGSLARSVTRSPASVGTPITQPVSQCPSKAADALTGSPFCIYNDRAYNGVIMSLTC